METYCSLFAISDEVRTGANYLGLFVVDEFSYVFLEDLPGLSPNWEIEFSIVLVPRVKLVSITPYRMTPTELIE